MSDNIPVTRIDAERRPINLKDFVKRQAQEADCDRLIDEPVAIYEGGELKILYLDLQDNPDKLVTMLHSLKFGDSRRSSGNKSTARTFGFMPRRVIRADFCHLSRMAEENPDIHTELLRYAERVTEFYQELNPGLYARHKSLMGNVLPEYRVGNETFTSGIVNKNNAISYHFDSGNIEDVWSCMLWFNWNVGGGNLCVPEYGLKFVPHDNSLFMFDGQQLLHGVTPIKLLHRRAYRYSIVYYSMRQMWNCDPLDEELARIRQLKTQREIKRADNSLSNPPTQA